MYKVRYRENRGRTMTDWADCSHTFSFAQYFDPFQMGFSDLCVINDNILKPSFGYGYSSQANMEVVNIILSGKMEYKAKPDYFNILSSGDVQVVNSGWGIEHSEFNPSYSEFLHYLQVWILPYKKDFRPNIEVKNFSLANDKNKIKLIVSGSGDDGSLKITQDADIYKSLVTINENISFDLPPNRKIWIQIATGAVEINSNILEAGDGLAIVNERGYLDISGVEEESEIYIFSLRNLTV